MGDVILKHGGLNLREGLLKVAKELLSLNLDVRFPWLRVLNESQRFLVLSNRDKALKVIDQAVLRLAVNTGRAQRVAGEAACPSYRKVVIGTRILSRDVSHQLPSKGVHSDSLLALPTA